MDEFGKKSNGHTDLQLEIYQGNYSRNDLRSYSVNSSYTQPNFYNNFDGQFSYDFDRKLKRAKTTSVSSSLSKVWCFNDPEYKRKKRVAGYRALTLEDGVYMQGRGDTELPSDEIWLNFLRKVENYFRTGSFYNNELKIIISAHINVGCRSRFKTKCYRVVDY
ncbi:hypothetical protein Cgig2_016301 [Carnegiea gigantea]|uniref:Uncharacterized protein n=1 Tax=Carnegiea gigantea TaxID=171969 RepID=A0A9Q1KFY2_9CARY|nr:hypothetical protein Cgig2_016301 [Carnegiea gigantea]